MERNEILSQLLKKLESEKARSKWSQAVKLYAFELLEGLEEIDTDALDNVTLLEKALLNGAQDWKQYSEGACSLVYDEDIAERCCTPSELKRTRNGELNPNGRETWLDVQARALYQASRLIKRLYKRGVK